MKYCCDTLENLVENSEIVVEQGIFTLSGKPYPWGGDPFAMKYVIRYCPFCGTKLHIKKVESMTKLLQHFWSLREFEDSLEV